MIVRTIHALAAASLLALAPNSPAIAQPERSVEAASPQQPNADENSPEALGRKCEARKRKKGPGLGSILGSARSSGLVGAMTGRMGGGGYVAGAVANTAIGVAAREEQNKQFRQPKEEATSC